MDPNGAWAKIKSETEGIGEIYKNYLIPLAAAGAIAEVVAGSIMGDAPMFGGVLVAVFQAAVSLAMVFVGALVLEWLAPKFQCTPSRLECFKFTGFASVVGGVSKLLVILPFGLSIAAMLLGLYGVYVAYVGFQPMTEVPDAKKWPMLLVYICCMIVVGIVLMMPLSLITAALLISA